MRSTLRASRGCFRIRGGLGASAARPGLLAALEGAKEGDTLTVWRIDRLGRSTLHLLQILDDLGRKGIALQSLMDGLDTNTAAGRMVFSMVSAMAEFERSVISERTKAGMAAARRRGRHVGRPAKLAPDQLDYARRMIVEGKEGRNYKSPARWASIRQRCGGCS
jgi:DNA invertase Pin-like site-specific DNA recombinase